MKDRYHSGEIEAQRRAGARELADRVGRIIGPAIPSAAAAFLSHRQFVVAATVSASGAVHASLLGGVRGFASATTPSTIEMRPEYGHTGDVRDDIEATGTIGLLAIDFSSRRRMRANGVAVLRDEAIVVSTREVYSNCPQYIHERADEILVSPRATRMSVSLSVAQQSLIRAADTFFIASSHPDAGADASHRGGDRGFVSAASTSLRWLDYPGNNMFNTIGNLIVNPRCGLLFTDFATGAALRIEGRASVEWKGERSISVVVDRVVQHG